MQAYLDKYPRERLSQEGAALVVNWLLDKDQAPDADVLKAVVRAMDLSMTGRKTETGLSYFQTFAERPERAALAIATGQEALKHSREAFDARVVYALHNALGELHYTRQDVTNAWKHFLSAAFMAPDDMSIVLNLARVYDKQGEVRRAYARYKRVAGTAGLPAEIGAEVKSAMARLGAQLPKDDPLLIDEAPKPAGPAGAAGGRGRGRSGGGAPVFRDR
jgi:Flp pilus assembly protein TadD